MASGRTLRKLIPFPKTVDGPKLCADDESLATTLDNLNEGHQDFLQAGVVSASDWSFTATINSSTGKLGSEAATGGVAWLPDPVVSGALMRSVTANAKLENLEATLPASGKYVTVAFELSPSTWGSSATVAIHTGAEKATQAEAESAPPATTAGRIKVRDVVVYNSAGKYEMKMQRDRRPWAKGFNYATLTNESAEIASGLSEALSPTVRLECSGSPILITLTCYAETTSLEPVGVSASVTADGLLTFVGGIAEFAHYRPAQANPVANCGGSGIYMLSTDGLVAGSHLFRVKFAKRPFEAGVVTFSYGMALRELVGSNANNGTS